MYEYQLMLANALMLGNVLILRYLHGLFLERNSQVQSLMILG